MSQVHIGGASLNQIPIDWNNNTSNILDAIDSAKKQGIELLCLPELTITSYGCQDLFLHEWVTIEAWNQLIKIVPQCTDITVAIGLPILFEQQLYNTTCIIEDGNIKGFYAKQFLANDGIHYEKRWFSPWPKNTSKELNIAGFTYPIGDITFDVLGITIGLEICEDAWHEDRPACRI